MPTVAVAGPEADTLAGMLRARHLADLNVATAAEEAVVATADILLGPPDALAKLLPAVTSVRWLQSTWAGVKPLLDQPRRDFLLTGVRGIFGQSMTEYVLGWLLALERRIIERAGARRHWDERIDRGVQGRHIGILGTGDIGRAVARGCATLGMKVTGLNSDGRDVAGFEACYAMADRFAFAGGLDYLVGLLPDTPATDNVVDRALLASLAPGAVFINAGRANCVVDQDLLAALGQGSMRAAVLDVTREEPLPASHPFWGAEHLYLTCHTAAPTRSAAVLEIFVDNYHRYRQGEPLANAIDFQRGY